MNISVREIILPSKQESDINLNGGSDLQAAVTEETLSAIQDIYKNSARRVFELTWTGHGRVPRGASLCGKTIEFTQNGFVYDAQGVDFGTYDRIDDNAGEKKDRNSMIVYLHPKKNDIIVN